MNLRTLLNKNKRSFTIYIIGAFMTTGNNLWLPLAIGQIFKILTVSNNKEVMIVLDKTIINVSHIIYEGNFELYDKVYLVNNHEVKRLNNFDDLKAHNIILFK